nr:BadF/BadG/BcrA/BcrD ATPase family protein [Auraticoccus cholistanensis]
MADGVRGRPLGSAQSAGRYGRLAPVSDPNPAPLLIGLDVGGTSTKAAVLDAAGQALGHATAAGGNHRSSAGDVSAYLRQAVTTALAGADPARVVAVAAGIAGAGSAAGSEVAERVAGDLAQVGVVAPLDVRTDLDIAFLAAAPAGDGVLLLSGTGAVAGRYRDGRLTRRCDGLGWRLGDEGSGYWIGAAALRAAVAALDGRGAPTRLTETLAGPLDVRAVTGDVRQDWVRAAAALTVGRTAALVPAVVSAADAGDPVAAGVVEAAVERLLGSFAVVADGAPGLDVVLAGGVLTADGPVRDGVSRALVEAGHRLHLSTRPVLGALVLAAQLAGMPQLAPASVTLPAPVRIDEAS